MASNPVKRFTAPLVEESSWGTRDVGTHECIMTLYPDGIEWVTDRGDVVWIGIWVDALHNLTDYDGVFSLPVQAIELLEENGITVSEEFR